MLVELFKIVSDFFLFALIPTIIEFIRAFVKLKKRYLIIEALIIAILRGIGVFLISCILIYLISLIIGVIASIGIIGIILIIVLIIGICIGL